MNTLTNGYFHMHGPPIVQMLRTKGQIILSKRDPPHLISRK